MAQADNINVLELATLWHTPHSPSSSRSTSTEILATASQFSAYLTTDPVGQLAALTLAVSSQKPSDPNAVRIELADLFDVADDFFTFIGEDS